MTKHECMKARGKPLHILSATFTNQVPGFIYIEAFKEVHVWEAVEGIEFIFPWKIVQVNRNEMPAVYDIKDNKMISLWVGQWVWIKQQGIYQNDIGRVYNDTDTWNGIYIKLIPRLIPEGQ